MAATEPQTIRSIVFMAFITPRKAAALDGAGKAIGVLPARVSSSRTLP